jgi:hypothetical protein
MRTEDRELRTEDRGPKTEATALDKAKRPPGSVFGPRSSVESCDYCGAEALIWRKCKLICEQCGNIVKSCADL